MPISDTLRATLERTLQGSNLDPTQRSTIEQTLASDLGGADVFDPAVQQTIATSAGETRFQPAGEPDVVTQPTPTPGVTTAGPQPTAAPTTVTTATSGLVSPTGLPFPAGVTATDQGFSANFEGNPEGMAQFLLSLGHDPATVQSVVNRQTGGQIAPQPFAPPGPFSPQQTQGNLLGGLEGLIGQLGKTSPTGTIGRPGQFGFAPGAVPGGDALQFLRDIGFPIPSSFSGLQTGQPLQAGDLGTASRQLGGLDIPSPQSLGRLDDTGLQLLMSIFETLLGIPFQDVQRAGLRPFQGLRGAPQGRTGLLG